jgi:hypothetical protein
MYEHTQIYKMYIKILRHGKRRKKIKLVNSNLRHVFIYMTIENIILLWLDQVKMTILSELFSMI